MRATADRTFRHPLGSERDSFRVAKDKSLDRDALSLSCIARVFCVAVAALAIGGNVGAQENQFPPSPPLQWPTEAAPGAAGFFALSSLRLDLEQGADAGICKQFLKDASIPIPDPFIYPASCPPNIVSKIDGRQGSPRWKQGARPTECGSNCMDAPLNVQTTNLGTPNARFATVNGNLDLDVDTPVGTRTIRFYFHVDAMCDIPAGRRTGRVNVTATVEPPTVEGPGTLETILGGFLELFDVHLSNDVTQQIEKSLGSQASSTTMTGIPQLNPACSSIGSDSSDFWWDVPPQTVRHPISEFVRPTVNLYFDHITNMIPPNSPGTTVIPPPIPRLKLYVNGVPAHVPLPPNVTSYDSKLCMSFPMDGTDRLQLLLNDGAGGAIWSQFTPAENFGTGSHSMTTVRNVIVKGPHGRPQKGTSPGIEFDYRVVFHPTPVSVGATPSSPTTGGPRSVRGPTATISTLGTSPEQTCVMSSL
jgi:hypothetical protein